MIQYGIVQTEGSNSALPLSAMSLGAVWDDVDMIRIAS